jgi:F-type H+-transporting ATPase subunit a
MVSSEQPNHETTAPRDGAPDSGASATAERETGRRFGRVGAIVAALVVVAVIDVLAFAFFPPFHPEQPGEPCPYPVCFIEGTLEFPAPHVVLDLGPGAAEPAGGLSIGFYPSITSTILTMWLVGAALLLAIFLMTRGRSLVPGRLQNVAEWAYEQMENFGMSIAGAAARPYIPIFISFLLLILFSNWAGLIPPVGRVEFLRAPTSDVNVTIGLALVSFAFFEFEGFRRLGARAYLAKFFPIYEFRNGIGAGLIAMFVGLIELMLDFVRPLTLSMRLFGNIYGGEVALGVVTALFLVVLPAALLGLEFMLNLIQALIFSILSLMYIVLAIEGHGHEEGHMAEDVVAAASSHGSERVPAAQHSIATA